MAFDVNTLANLRIVDNLRSASYGSVATASPVVVMGENQLSDGGAGLLDLSDPGFSTSGGNLGEDGEPYGVGICFGVLDAFSMGKGGCELDVNSFASEEQVCQWTGQVLLGSFVTIGGVDCHAETRADLFPANDELGLDLCALV